MSIADLIEIQASILEPRNEHRNRQTSFQLKSCRGQQTPPTKKRGDITLSTALIGTSGYSYDHWMGPFYPRGLARSKWLPHYAKHLFTVEINYSFYHLPSHKTLENWAERTPVPFRFALKASRGITHRGSPDRSGRLVKIFAERVRILGSKMGPILYQFPGRLDYDLTMLERFLALLPNDIRSAIEFRSDAWATDEVFQLLRRYGVGYCIASAPGLSCHLKTTARFAYIRMHGISSWYTYKYTESDLRWWGDRIGELLDRGCDVYVYFNNDYRGYAPSNALRLKQLLEKS